MAALRALRYFGGKAGGGKAQWIASLLPWEWKQSYVEVFGGMFGVGLSRPPVQLETLNDLDERVMNWWRVLRDEPERFGRAVTMTPISRVEHARSIQDMDDPSLTPFERALAFHVFAQQSVYAQYNSENGVWSGAWRRAKSPSGSFSRWLPEQVDKLAERMWRVQLEQRDAVQVLGDFAGTGDAVLYVDPPYRDADPCPYMHSPDRDALGEALLAQRGSVAVSGYNDEWDHLGWRRVEKETLRCRPGEVGAQRTEVLWMNYDRV